MRPWRKKVDRKKSISLPSGENHLKSHKIKHSPCHFPNSLLLVTNENNVLFTQLSPVRASHVKSPLFFLDRFTSWGKSRFSLLFPCESLGPHAAPGSNGRCSIRSRGGRCSIRSRGAFEPAGRALAISSSLPAWSDRGPRLRSVRREIVSRRSVPPGGTEALEPEMTWGPGEVTHGVRQVPSLGRHSVTVSLC